MGGGTELGKVRGLGSAKHGSHHWLVQRVSAFGNIILVGWLVATFAMMPSLDHDSVIKWLSQPLTAIAAMLMIANLFWHIRLGLRVLIEDYVHDDGPKIFTLLLLNFYTIACAAIGIFSVARIAFGGAAG